MELLHDPVKGPGDLVVDGEAAGVRRRDCILNVFQPEHETRGQ